MNNPETALQWLATVLGPEMANLLMQRCAKAPETMESVVVAAFPASDPRRQTFRQCVRLLLETHKQKEE